MKLVNVGGGLNEGLCLLGSTEAQTKSSGQDASTYHEEEENTRTRSYNKWRNEDPVDAGRREGNVGRVGVQFLRVGGG